MKLSTEKKEGDESEEREREREKGRKIDIKLSYRPRGGAECRTGPFRCE